MDIILAVILGTSFGFVLHRVGASNPENIINMLRLRDFHLMKVILLGTAVASSVLFLGLVTGAISPEHLSVKASYWGVLVGGAVLGVGWAVAGYCPGTGVAALGDGRKDAIFFVLGGLFGAYLYIVVYSKLKGTFLLEKIHGGKVTLALTPNESYKALIENVPGVVVALIVAITLGLVVWVLPGKSR